MCGKHTGSQGVGGVDRQGIEPIGIQGIRKVVRRLYSANG